MANPLASFIRRLVGGSAPEQKAPEVRRELIPFGEFAPYGFDYFLTPDWSVTQQLEKYVGWVYACVTKIAEEFAAINLSLYKQNDQGDIEEVPTHPALDLLDRVNPYMTLYELMELTATNQALTGNAYWWLLRNGQGEIVEIYPWLRPDRMTVIPDVKNFIKGYKYQVPGTSDPVLFEPTEIIHFKSVNPMDPYTGSSPVKAGSTAISTDDNASKYNLRFFGNNARPDGVLQFKDGIDQIGAKRIMEAWQSRHGAGNEHKIAVLSKGEYKPTSLTQKDMDFLQSRNFSRDEILAMFKVPKSLLGITEDVNYATAEAARKMFLKQVIVPKVRKFVQYLNEFLLPQFVGGDGLFFDFENPVPEDQTMTLEYYANGLTHGWLSPNEVRAMEGFAEYDGGSNIMVPFNLVPGGSTDQVNTVKVLQRGQVKTIRIPKKYNVRLRSRTETAKRIELTKEAIKESGIAKKIATKMVSNREARSKDVSRKENILLRKDLLSDDPRTQLMWQKVWQIKINKTDNQERLFILLLRREFDRQRDRVLKTLSEKSFGKTKALEFEFNVNEEKDVFARIFQPVLNDIIRDHGKDALAILGRDKFDTNEAARQYVRDQGLKFAKEINDVTRQAIKEQLDEAIAAGESLPKVKERVSGVFKEASAGRAMTIARTEVARASNFGTLEGFKQSGVVTYTEWFTALDEAVCPFCAPMHGKKASIDHQYFSKGDSFMGKENHTIDLDYGGVEAGNLHVNCRCVLIPHTDEVELWDKEKTEEGFDLKEYQGSDAEMNEAARQQVRDFYGRYAPELSKFADHYNWQVQYTDINQLRYQIAGDDVKVAEYVAAFKKGDKFPPIAAVIIQHGFPAEVIDGAHRLAALRQLGAQLAPIIIGRARKL